MALDPIINYDAHIISPGVNLTLYGVGTPNLRAEYDDFGLSGVPSVIAHCSLSINYENITWVINNNNSITVSGNITGAQLVRTATGTSDAGKQTIRAYFNTFKKFETVVDTDSSGTYDLNIPNSFSVTIPPSNDPQPQYPASIEFYNAVTGTLGPDRFYLGIIITNPNPPDYRPGAIRNSGGTWLSHNRSGGEVHILTSGGTWKEERTSDGGVGHDNPPSIRKDNSWFNQRRIGKES